jgi:hypothetical protein
MYSWENSCEMYDLWEISHIPKRCGKFPFYLGRITPPPPSPGQQN